MTATPCLFPDMEVRPVYQGGGASYMVKVQALKVSEGLPTMECNTPEAAYRYWKSVISLQPWFDVSKEHLIVLALNTRYRITDFAMVSIGTLNESLAHPREILRPVIVLGAYGFMMMHNHPSGDPTPSEADHRLTRRIKECADLLQVRMLDHVITGEPTPEKPRPFFSFLEAGVI